MILESPNRLKLAVFSQNCSSGSTMTTAEGPPRVEWDETVEITRLAEEAGIEAVIPVARWKGMGGDCNFNHRTFETFTWAAGLAAVTSKIDVFATFHIPTVHPVRAAKEAATVDHISGGRFGLNVVAGWNAPELAMFGLDQREHDERYEAADEWIAFVEKIWATEGEFDWDGRFFQGTGVYSEPKPVQRPRPPIMSAGLSPRGREFAARWADLNFILLPSIADAAPVVAEIKELARSYDRSLEVFGMGYIVCGDTEQEAADKLREYAVEKGDWRGADNLLEMLIPNSQSAAPDVYRAMAFNIIAGYAALPLVGTPEQIVDGMLQMVEAGMDGITVSWLDYAAGLREYQEKLLPLLIQAGIRVDSGGGAADVPVRAAGEYRGDQLVAEVQRKEQPHG